MRRSQNFGLLKWQNPRTPVETENQKAQIQILKRPLRTLFVHQSESNFLVSTGVRGFCLQQFRNFGHAHIDMHQLYADFRIFVLREMPMKACVFTLNCTVAKCDNCIFRKWPVRASFR